MTDTAEPRPLTDAELIAWAVVLGCRGMQRHSGVRLLLLPFPACPSCGEKVYDVEESSVERGITRTAILTLRPCGHIHTAEDFDLHRLHDHIGDMLAGLDERWNTDDIIREARARVGEPTPAATEATEPEHVCRPGAATYFCPTSGDTESDCHGGHDRCCDRPDLHRPADDAATALAEILARLHPYHRVGGGPPLGYQTVNTISPADYDRWCAVRDAGAGQAGEQP